MFKNVSDLERHLPEHDVEKLHKCDKCGKSFHMKRRLKRHIQLHQEDKKIRTCHFYNNNKEHPLKGNQPTANLLAGPLDTPLHVSV